MLARWAPISGKEEANVLEAVHILDSRSFGEAGLLLFSLSGATFLNETLSNDVLNVGVEDIFRLDSKVWHRSGCGSLYHFKFNTN